MIKDRIKRFIIGHSSLNSAMFLFYKLKNGQIAKHESEVRKSLPLFAISELSKDIPFAPEEFVIDNNLYGQTAAIRRFAGIDKPIEAYLEHGLFWGGMIHADEHYWYVPKIITYSQHRKQGIETHQTGKEVICIGPYIHYAENIYDVNPFQKLKNELGKVLLVFPSKSILNVESRYDVDAFNAEIEKRAESFDTVLISLFYLDARNDVLVNRFTEKGYRVVTSGHKYDHHFIDRQRTIIELADMTMSNEVGTHVGYCIYLNKPHYIFEQNLERVGSNQKELDRELNLYSSKEDKVRALEKREVVKRFKNWRTDISTDQRETIDKYWGTSAIKTPEELKQLLSN